MQMQSILERNPEAKIMKISASAHQGLTEVLRELWQIIDTTGEEVSPEEENIEEDIPVITLTGSEQKRRPRHERYQKGDRNTIITLDSASDDEFDG